MTRKHTSMRRVGRRWLVLILTLGVSMSALAGLLEFGGKSWTEEVRLRDGRIIRVERQQNLGSRPTLESRERRILDETITFTLPGSDRKVVWAMSFRDDVPEPNGVNVFLIDIVGDTPYLAGYPAGCIAYNKWKRPNPPQILFKYANGQWQRTSVAEFPPQVARANLIVGGPPVEGIKPHYTSADVDAENRVIDTPEYKTILREPVKSGTAGSSVNCIELIQYKDSWIMPNDSVMRRLLDRPTKQ